MAKVIFGNHSSVIVPRNDRDDIRRFYCEVLGGQLSSAEDDRDFIRLGGDFHIAFLYGDVPDASEFLRTARSPWLEIKADDVEELKRRILAFGVRKLDVPNPFLYFQAPGGQCLRLVGVDDDLSAYEGAGGAPNVGKVKEALERRTHGRKPVTADLRAGHAAKAITDGDVVLATIDIPATPERVVRALLTNECERWWGAPGVYAIESWKATVRPGGTWSLVIRLPDGAALPSSGEFLEVTPTKIVQTRRYDFDHPTLGRRVTKVTTLLSPVDQGTRIVVRHDGFGASEPAVEHAGGWERMLDWLGEHLRAEAARTASAKGGAR